MMKIAVIGLGSGDYKKEILEKAGIIGREIARNKCALLTGACNGYGYEAVKGAFEEKGLVIGYSPAKNLEEHKAKYSYPTEKFTKFVFTGMGVPGRNFPLVMAADAVIAIGGKSGTLIEFAIAIHEAKPIGVLKGSGGIAALIKKIAAVCDKMGEKDKIIYSSNPKELVEKIIMFSKK